MRYLFVLFVLIASPVRAETFFSVPTTSDFSVSAHSTVEVVLPKVVFWIYIRKHCSDDVYFAINPKRGQVTTPDFPLRLGQNEEFVVPLRVATVGASSAALSTSTCTFTIMGGAR